MHHDAELPGDLAYSLAKAARIEWNRIKCNGIVDVEVALQGLRGGPY